MVLLDELGHPGYRGLATSSKAALVAEELFFCTHVPKIPPAWAECISQPSGYSHHEAQAFLAQYTIKITDRRVLFVTVLSRLGQTRAFACSHGCPRGNNETRPTVHSVFMIHINGDIV